MEIPSHPTVPVTGSSPLFRAARFFFVAMAILFLAIALFGFVPTYQRMGKRLFPLHWFAHVHGAMMAGWLVVFLVQSILGATNRLKFHRQLGQFSVVLGVLIWISMGIISVVTLIADRPPENHFLFDVLILELYLMALFGLFFTWGILERKNAVPHKRLLFLATLLLIQAGIDRIRWLPGIHSALEVRFYYLDAFVLLLFIYDLIMLRRIHKVSAIGALIIVIAQVIVVQSWGSPAWHKFWFHLINLKQNHYLL